MTDEKPITLEQAVQQVVSELDGPTPVSEVARRALAIHPSTAKQQKQQVRNHLSGHWGKTWVYLDAKTVIPLQVVLRGARFRIDLSRLEVKHGVLLLESNFRGFAPPHAPPENLTLLNAAGQPLPARPTTIKSKNVSSIRYPESFAPIEQLMGREKVKPKALSFSVAQGQQVYRFKAALKYRKGLWRRIEIQGAQTLQDLDNILRDEFKHDFSDHLSGFWRKLRRGDTKRYREVDLGAIEPFGGGDGADTRIAGLGLAVGDELKYVYDFGDWIEHTIILEAIVEPEEGVKYPRVVARSRPQYQDCERCAEAGRQTRATWICQQCSSEQGREVLLCEDCLMAEHEEHYADEIVY